MSHYTRYMELMEALYASSKSSKELEQLLREARQCEGSTRAELIEKLKAVDKTCDECMNRVENASRSYYRRRSAD